MSADNCDWSGCGASPWFVLLLMVDTMAILIVYEFAKTAFLSVIKVRPVAVMLAWIASLVFWEGPMVLAWWLDQPGPQRLSECLVSGASIFVLYTVARFLFRWDDGCSDAPHIAP